VRESQVVAGREGAGVVGAQDSLAPVEACATEPATRLSIALSIAAGPAEEKQSWSMRASVSHYRGTGAGAR
jgi:hypothetical protein